MEVTFAAVLAACGGWFRRKVLTRLDPVYDSPTPSETADPFTRYYNPAEFQELTEPYREARHRLWAKIAKKRWKMNPAYMGMPRLDELDAVVEEARETRTSFAVFWNHERVKDDELHDLVKQEYARLVQLEMDAEDARFEWLEQVARWLDGTGALSLAEIHNQEPKQWSGAVRQALDRQVNGKSAKVQKSVRAKEASQCPPEKPAT
nr:hypothetical protein [uncultured Roseibium sp.]